MPKFPPINLPPLQLTSQQDQSVSQPPSHSSSSQTNLTGQGLHPSQNPQNPERFIDRTSNDPDCQPQEQFLSTTLTLGHEQQSYSNAYPATATYQPYLQSTQNQFVVNPPYQAVPSSSTARMGTFFPKQAPSLKRRIRFSTEAKIATAQGRPFVGSGEVEESSAKRWENTNKQDQIVINGAVYFCDDDIRHIINQRISELNGKGRSTCFLGDLFLKKFGSGLKGLFRLS